LKTLRMIPFLFIFLTSISPTAETSLFAQTTGAPAVTSTGNLSRGRFGHTATLLPSGKVLIAGGDGVECTFYNSPRSYSCYVSVNDTAELYDPVTGVWSLTESFGRRTEHSATLLPNGNVLVVGGYDYNAATGNTYWGRLLNSAELYDPAAGLWRPAPPPSSVHGANKAVLLASGEVLVVGRDLSNQVVAELFDPSTESWSGTRPPSATGMLTLLTSGNVLSAMNGLAELYDPATETWSRSGDLNLIRVVETLTLLNDGRVLATGHPSDYSPRKAELYDPSSGSWKVTAGGLNIGSPDWATAYTATRLATGQVLVAGGYKSFDAPADDPSPLELFDPASETWALMPALRVRRDYNTATLLSNDKVLFAGGVNENYQFPVFQVGTELFDSGLPRQTRLTIDSTSFCSGSPWSLRIDSSSPNSTVRLIGTSGGQSWEVPNWVRTNGDGSIVVTGTFPAGSDGTHTLRVEVDGKVSNEVHFTVGPCQVQLSLNANAYCTGASWNVKVTSDFPAAWLKLLGTTNGTP
jgi:Galactose oxidase, central domain